MPPIFGALAVIQAARNRYNVFDWIGDLTSGDSGAWIVLGVLIVVVAGMAAYQRVTGHAFPDKKRRRAARRRRKKVLWEYERDAD